MRRCACVQHPSAKLGLQAVNQRRVVNFAKVISMRPMVLAGTGHSQIQNRPVMVKGPLTVPAQPSRFFDSGVQWAPERRPRGCVGFEP